MILNRRTFETFDALNYILDNFFEPTVAPTGAKTPVHDVIENDKEFIIEMLLAGIKKEDVNIDIDNDELNIKAERKADNTLKYNRKQTYSGKYERTIVLPDSVDKEKIDASMVDGILRIVIPKLENNMKSGKLKIEVN